MEPIENISVKRKPIKCLVCGLKKVVVIAYGYPSEEMWKDLEAGKE